MANGIRAVGKGQQGFTLVEVIVVLVIIGILTAIAVPRLTGVTNQAKERACEANIKAIETAITAYSVAHDGSIPDEVSDLVGDYLVEEPKCPFSQQAGYSIAPDGTVTCAHCSKDNSD